MASSAGLRARKQVLRFADEYGTMGSGETPHSLQRAVYKQLYTPKYSNGMLGFEFMKYTGTCGDIAAREWTCYDDEMEYTCDEVLEQFRQRAFASVGWDDYDPRLFASYTYAEKDICAYYCPYYELGARPDGEAAKHVMEKCGMGYKCWVEHDYELAQRTMDELPIHERRLVEVIERIAKEVYELYYSW